MNVPGIVLVHGYSGRAETLAPVHRLLVEQYGADAVHTVHLPGHGEFREPSFDALQFGALIDAAVRSFQKDNRRIILLGHSTGGTLALDHLQRTGTVPALLILAGTPAAIAGRDLAGWEQHRRKRSEISLLNVARMVSCVNRVGATRMETPFPVLVLQGGADPLVPATHAEMWCRDSFSGSVRCIVVPGAGHDLFEGPGSGTVLDCLRRAVADEVAEPGPREQAAADALQALDCRVSGFIAARPQSIRHIVRAPGASRALNKQVGFDPVASADPLQLNIEITSRCNLSCGHCARSLRNRSGKDMDRHAFKYLLDLMPNSFKVVLVGLGEPTLHPQLIDFVALAAQRGRRVELVTNAMGLEKALSRGLIAAGLGGLTFSLDSVDPDVAARVRTGSNLDQIMGNIRDFLALAGDRIPTAVFTAVSLQTVQRLQTLGETVAALGVKAWVLSDLNFQWNLSRTLWRNCAPDHQDAVAGAVKAAFSNSLPVLSVRGIEELGLARRYADFLITAPSGLGQRSLTHAWCLSPWQTLPVDVDGNATACDCRPHATLGNLLEEPFSSIWNGPSMQAHRRRMRSETPPADCRVCPRF